MTTGHTFPAAEATLTPFVQTSVDVRLTLTVTVTLTGTLDVHLGEDHLHSAGGDGAAAAHAGAAESQEGAEDAKEKVGDSAATDQHVEEEGEVDAVVGDQVDGQPDVLQHRPVGRLA